jgi:hypothetical protein
MPYQTEIDVLDNHIRVVVTGERVPGHVADDASLVMEQTIEAIGSSGIRNCLIVLDLAGNLTAMDSFDMVSVSEEVGWKRDYRVAFVNLNPESLESAQFTEIVAGNRAYPLRVFGNEEDAKDWLLSMPHNG